MKFSALQFVFSISVSAIVKFAGSPVDICKDIDTISELEKWLVDRQLTLRELQFDEFEPNETEFWTRFIMFLSPIQQQQIQESFVKIAKKHNGQMQAKNNYIKSPPINIGNPRAENYRTYELELDIDSDEDNFESNIGDSLHPYYFITKEKRYSQSISNHFKGFENQLNEDFESPISWDMEF